MTRFTPAAATVVIVPIGEGKSGVGIYAIPDLGVNTFAGDSGAVFGGTMGFSVWY